MKTAITVNVFIGAAIVFGAFIAMKIVRVYAPWAWPMISIDTDIATLKALAVGCALLSVAGPVVLRREFKDK